MSRFVSAYRRVWTRLCRAEELRELEAQLRRYISDVILPPIETSIRSHQ